LQAKKQKCSLLPTYSIFLEKEKCQTLTGQGVDFFHLPRYFDSSINYKIFTGYGIQPFFDKILDMCIKSAVKSGKLRIYKIG